MANAIIRHIPNTVTCLNLFSGCIACVMAFEAKYELAVTFIILSAVFDFSMVCWHVCFMPTLLLVKNWTL